MSARREPAKKNGVLQFMTRDAEGPYFASRERDEQSLSREAIDWRVAAAHAELAARYEALAAVFGAKRLTKLPIDYD
jgi:hypothetical protein